MKRFSSSFIFTVFIFTLSVFTIQNAYATVITVSDGPSCNAINGIWGFYPNSCTVSVVQINPGDTWIVSVDLWNIGTFKNFGILNVTATVVNFYESSYPSIDNFGTINIFGAGYLDNFSGIFTNNPGGIINNYWILDNNERLYNSGTINNYGTIYNSDFIQNNPTGKIFNLDRIANVGIIKNLCGKIVGPIIGIQPISPFLCHTDEAPTSDILIPYPDKTIDPCITTNKHPAFCEPAGVIIDQEKIIVYKKHTVMIEVAEKISFEKMVSGTDKTESTKEAVEAKRLADQKAAEKEAKMKAKMAERDSKLSNKEKDRKAKLAEKEAEVKTKMAEKEAHVKAKIAESKSKSKDKERGSVQSQAKEMTVDKEKDRKAKLAEKEAEVKAKIAEEEAEQKKSKSD